jgi:hypothetical protein
MKDLVLQTGFLDEQETWYWTVKMLIEKMKAAYDGEKNFTETLSSCLKETQEKYKHQLEKDSNWTKYLLKTKEMKIILDNFLNFSSNMKELQINSKLNQIMIIEKEIKKIIDSVHNTKTFLAKLEEIEQVSMNEEQYVSHELSQKIIKLRLRAKAQAEEMNQLLDVYKGIIELINAKLVRQI